MQNAVLDAFLFVFICVEVFPLVGIHWGLVNARYFVSRDPIQSDQFILEGNRYLKEFQESFSLRMRLLSSQEPKNAIRLS